MTALHSACINDHLEVSEQLIQSGASLDIKTLVRMWILYIV